MKINKLTEKNLKTIYPNKSKVSLENMSKEELSEYLKIYNLYRKLYIEYVIEKLELRKFDKLIEKSELEFSQTIEEDMDIYQYFSSKELKYFYIRNNVYVERLNDEEIDILKEKIKNKDYELDNISRVLIENTYNKVIFEGRRNDGKKYVTTFGPNSRNFLASSHSIVIGFRYNEFDDSGLSDNDWRERHIKQLEYMSEIFKNIIENNRENSKMLMSIFKYNEFSVIKKVI